MESALRRQLLVHADRLFREAGNLHFEVGRFTKAAPPGNGVQEFAVHLMKLAHAMWTHARTFDPGTEIPNGRQPAAGPEETPFRMRRRRHPVTATEAAAEKQAHQEEEVLADLIQHYWQSSNVLDWLPAEAFTAGPRRDVYEAVAALGRAGRPIDELTVEWHLASRRLSASPATRAGSAGARARTRSLAELWVTSAFWRLARRGRRGHHDRPGATRTPRQAAASSPVRAHPRQAALANQLFRPHPASASKRPEPKRRHARSPCRRSRPALLQPGHRTCSNRRLAGPRQPGPQPRP